MCLEIYININPTFYEQRYILKKQQLYLHINESLPMIHRVIM